VIDLDEIDRLTGGRIGTFDTPCPLCSPFRRHKNQRIKVLRIWRIEPDFASFHCAHCGASGHSRAQQRTRPDPVRLAKARAEAAERDRNHRRERLTKAMGLWTMAGPISGTIAQTYLRARGYDGLLPDTLRFLPARGEYAPAMVAAFGIPREIEPGIIRIAADAITGVHLTRLLPDGSDRERGEQGKIMVGQSKGSPIVLAPPNDLLGMAITEGIEDALTVHAATGLGAWAAGSASRMPELAAVMPGYIEAVTIYAHDDDAGKPNAIELARRLTGQGVEVFIEGLE
jgi:hypothetical protein